MAIGSKFSDAKTPVSSPATVVVLSIKVLNGMLVKLVKANDPVVGVWIGHLVVTVNHVVTDQRVIVPVIV
ncbi:TPA: hypothetical protein DCZ39_05445 [Patescibacteria group bacterium]|nr:hypothetical protein [Candidatus Gracilibacteria bacterium]